MDAACRDYATSLGYDEFPLAIGHQVGRHPHDGTALVGPEWEKHASKGHHPLEPGMVFTIEPRISVAVIGTGSLRLQRALSPHLCEAPWTNAYGG